jgi:holliday junction DNA helicase RuvA
VISSVRGRVAHVQGDSVVIDIGAIGLTVLCSALALREANLGSHVDLPVTLIVREESLTLFGFADVDERTLFELLQTVSGVGPKVGLAALSTLGADGLRTAIAREDLVALTSVPGVGRKGAERMIIELRDRVGTVATSMSPPSTDQGWQAQVRTGLMGLGWSPRDADNVISRIERDPDVADAVAAGDVALILRAALRGLDRA